MYPRRQFSIHSDTDPVLVEWFKVPGNYQRLVIAGKNREIRGRQCERKKHIYDEITQLLHQRGIARSLSYVRQRGHLWFVKIAEARAAARERGINRDDILRVFPYFYDIDPQVQPMQAAAASTRAATPLYSAVDRSVTEEVQPADSTAAQQQQQPSSAEQGLSGRHCSPSSPLQPASSQLSTEQQPPPSTEQSQYPQQQGTSAFTAPSTPPITRFTVQQQQEQQQVPACAGIDDDEPYRQMYYELQQQVSRQQMSIYRAQEMKAKASLVQSLKEAGFSKEEIWMAIQGHCGHQQHDQ